MYTVIQAVHWLLYTVAKCHFFGVVPWQDIIKYLLKCEGCTHFCEILYLYSIYKTHVIFFQISFFFEIKENQQVALEHLKSYTLRCEKWRDNVLKCCLYHSAFFTDFLPHLLTLPLKLHWLTQAGHTDQGHVQTLSWKMLKSLTELKSWLISVCGLVTKNDTFHIHTVMWFKKSSSK